MGSSPEGTEEIGQERQLLPKRPQPRRPEIQKDYCMPQTVWTFDFKPKRFKRFG